MEGMMVPGGGGVDGFQGVGGALKNDDRKRSARAKVVSNQSPPPYETANSAAPPSHASLLVEDGRADHDLGDLVGVDV